MKVIKSIVKIIAASAVCVLLFGTAGCSVMGNIDKDKVLCAYNDILNHAGKVVLTNDISLKGQRKFDSDEYVGTYKADYKNFTGTEYLFGSTSIKRKAGRYVTVNCTFNVASGTAQLFWFCKDNPPVMLLEGSGQCSRTIELPEGSSYIGVSGNNLKGSIELKITNAKIDKDI